MKRPLSFAAYSTSASTSASCSKSRVVVITNCTGGPPVEPGRAGGENERACAVARLLIRGDSSCKTVQQDCFQAILEVVLEEALGPRGDLDGIDVGPFGTVEALGG